MNTLDKIRTQIVEWDANGFPEPKYVYLGRLELLDFELIQVQADNTIFGLAILPLPMENHITVLDKPLSKSFLRKVVEGKIEHIPHEWENAGGV